jgi:hypothetical protein
VSSDRRADVDQPGRGDKLLRMEAELHKRVISRRRRSGDLARDPPLASA